MPTAGFESATPATKRQKTYALDRTATGIGECSDKALKLSHDRFLPNPYQFTIIHLSYH
jgi:hypothetical protein